MTVEQKTILTGGKLGEASCDNCGMPLGASLVCRGCGWIHTKPTNLCQKPDKLVEPPKLRRPGSFGD